MSRHNSEKREMVNWFTTVLFDVEIRLQDHWVKLWIYRPVSWFSCKQSVCKFVNLTISGGIGPIQSQAAKKGRWWTGSPRSIWRLLDHWVKAWVYRPVSLLEYSQSCCKFVNLTISGGIGPIQSQDVKTKQRKGRWWTGSPTSIWRKDIPMAALETNRKVRKL